MSIIAPRMAIISAEIIVVHSGLISKRKVKPIFSPLVHDYCQNVPIEGGIWNRFSRTEPTRWRIPNSTETSIIQPLDQPVEFGLKRDLFWDCSYMGKSCIHAHSHCGQVRQLQILALNEHLSEVFGEDVSITTVAIPRDWSRSKSSGQETSQAIESVAVGKLTVSSL